MMDATPVTMPVPVVMPAPPVAPPITVTYRIGSRLVVVPAGEPLPPNLFAPVPQTMPSCPGGQCPVPVIPARRGWFR